MKCLQCGKEIPEGRKFCSSSCSAKYNNVRRQRRPWTEEQHKKHRKPVQKNYCCICGKEIKTDRQYCKSCSSKYGSVVPVLQKLCCWTGDINQSLQKAETFLAKRYFEDKESLLSLAQEYGICKDTIRWYIRRQGLALRDFSESTKLSIEQGRQQIVGNPQFKSGTHISWEGRKFHFRSSWEEEYMKQLDEQKVSYLYEPFSIRYYDTQRNEERVAIPDFFFPETNTIVELKSSFTYDEQNIRDKFQSYRKKGYKAELLLDWQKIEI